MKKLIMIMLFGIYLVSNIFSQSESKNNKETLWFICVDIVYPTISDEEIKELKFAGTTPEFIYPLLVVNNVIIRDSVQVNCFRNNHLQSIIKTKFVLAEKAKKMNIPDVPKDGVLFVTTKKGYYFNFSCE